MEDVYLYVLTQLPLQDIYKCMQVDKTMYNASQQPYLWGKLLGNKYEEIKTNTLYETYKKVHQLTMLKTKLKIKVNDVIELINLKILDLDNNQLTTILQEIGQLTNLQRLNLDNNQLTTIPLEIGQLTNLQILHLSNNKLTTIPQEIKKMNILHFVF